MARRINVDGLDVLTPFVAEFGARMVHLSSDLVYSGVGAGGYLETDPVDPVTMYGKSMAEAEALLAARLPSGAMLRISLPMGPSFNRHAGAIDWIDSRFRAGRPATLYFDEVRSAVYVDELTAVCVWFLSNELSGIFHCGAARPVTLYQTGQIVNKVGGYAPELLKGCPRIEAGPIPPRAGNVSMNSGKLIDAIGFDPFTSWPAGEGLYPGDDRDWHRRRPNDADSQLTSTLGRRAIVERLYRFPELDSHLEIDRWLTGVPPLPGSKWTN
jgi:dTDP-4-dehydrorhamnose reductase